MENKYLDAKRKREVGGGQWEELGDWNGHIYIYTIDTMYKIGSYWEHTLLAAL